MLPDSIYVVGPADAWINCCITIKTETSYANIESSIYCNTEGRSTHCFLIYCKGKGALCILLRHGYRLLSQTSSDGSYWLIRHPSVSRDYGNVLWMEDLEQRLVWLRRPIWEWQSLPHWRKIQSVLSSFLILLVSGQSFCLGLLDKCLFKMGEAMMHRLPPGWTLRCQGFSSVEVHS